MSSSPFELTHKGVINLFEEILNFGLYYVEVGYQEYLHSVDSEVRYSRQVDYSNKPYLGVLVNLSTYKYFVPLTSPKARHSSWENVGQAHYLIYEPVTQEELRPNDIVKNDGNRLLKVLSALEINKMIPVPEGAFNRINFDEQDPNYRALLRKEYLFLQNVQDNIKRKAKQIYNVQKQLSKVYPKYCNFTLLEQACCNWSADGRQ